MLKRRIANRILKKRIAKRCILKIHRFLTLVIFLGVNANDEVEVAIANMLTMQQIGYVS